MRAGTRGAGRRRSVLLVLAVAAAFSPGAWGAPARPDSDPGVRAAAEKLAPALRSRALESASIMVWLEFRDKGERDAADLAAALDRAEAALVASARARRRRAGIEPMVDYRDLPVCPAYLDSLATLGMPPLAVSRWFNRAAVRVSGRRLIEVAGASWIERIVPVERARRMPDPVGGHAEPRRPGSSLVRTETAGAIDHGRSLDQLEQIGLAELHQCGFSGAGILICLLDDGFTYHDTHEALRDQVIAPGRKRDFVDRDTVVTDVAGFGQRHGTSVLGCIGANRSGAYVGAAFGAEFALARTEEDFSEQPVEMLYWGMGAEWADSLGADVISSSVGYYQFDDPESGYTYADMDGRTTDVTNAARIAAEKGILVVNAVGNLGNQAWRYLIAPADVDGDSLIAVGAVNAFGDTVHFSSAGPTADGRIKPDLVARGSGAAIVLAGSDPGGYGTGAGTSFSAPIVAGLAACLLEAHPEWTPQQVITALRSTASRAGAPDQKMGYGIPDAIAAFRWPDIVGGNAGTRFLELQVLGPNPVRLGEGPARVELGLGAGAPATLGVRVRILDPLGRSVRKLWSGTLCIGERPALAWDGRDDDGRTVPSGLYWITLEGEGQRRAARLVALE